jgi:xanthine dehydrogenase accessory factor
MAIKNFTSLHKNMPMSLLPTKPFIWVSIERFEGSSPREAGAGMVVTAQDTVMATLGTIGGGHLEFEAIAQAQRMLADGQLQAHTQRYALGPSLGQCCGGVVWLRFELVPSDVAIKREAIKAYFVPGSSPKSLKIALFGGGHVGRAIVQMLGKLPCSVHWIDSRDEIFPEQLPANVHAEHCDPVQVAVKDLAAQSHVLIMSFSHAQDLDIVAACLLRVRAKNDLPFIGLIGSKTKWATFRHRLEERGFSQQELAKVTCPIGTPGLRGKEPEVIAVSVAAQLMGLRQL